MNTFRPYRFPFASYPAVRIVLLFGAGIAADHYRPVFPGVWGAMLALLLSIFFIMELIHARSLHTFHYRIGIVTYLLSLFFLGCFWHALSNPATPSPSQQLLDTYRWKAIQFRGEIYRIKRSSSSNTQVDIKIDTTFLNPSTPWARTYNIRALANPRELALSERLQLGNRISFTATIYPLEEKRNPHEFDYKKYLASQNIHIQAGIDSIASVSNSRDNFSWNILRRSTLNLIDQNFHGNAASLAKALLLGYKDELDKSQKQAFARAGLSHIMAVSGLHVGFVLAPFWLLIPFFWTSRYGRQVGLAILIGLLYFYAGLTGFSASVVRASIAGGFITYGRLFYKVRDPRNLTALAALLILLFNPEALFDIGFQLSFSAVYIILLALPSIQRHLPAWVTFRWYGQPVLIVIVSVVVQLGLFPLLSFYFGEFSLSGPFINAFIIPFLGFIVPYSLILLLVSAAFPIAGAWLNTPNQWFLEFLQWMVQQTSAWDGSWMNVHVQSPLFFLIWIIAIFIIAALHIPCYRWKLAILLFALLCFQQEVRIYQKLVTPELKITLFDVGQGDAALVTTPGGKHFMIDTGRWTPDYNSAESVILPYLKTAGIHNLDAVFLSHPHADHIGGVSALIDAIPIDTIYNSGFPYDSRLYKTYIRKASAKDIPIISLQAGDRLNIDPSVPIFIYGPQPFTRGRDPNEHCLILELVYGSKQFLFEGDAGKRQEEQLLHNFGNLIDTDFLKVAHHGSRTSSSTAFIQAASPDIASVSVALHNRFRHPNPDAVQRLRNSGSHLYFTSLSHALIFVSDGSTIKRIKWLEN